MKRFVAERGNAGQNDLFQETQEKMFFWQFLLYK